MELDRQIGAISAVMQTLEGLYIPFGQGTFLDSQDELENVARERGFWPTLLGVLPS